MIPGTLDNINTNLDRLWRLQATCVIPLLRSKPWMQMLTRKKRRETYGTPTPKAPNPRVNPC